MNNQENQNKLEALLFFKGTSVSKKEAGKILGLDASSLQEAINSLKESYQGKGSLLLVENDEYIEIRLEKEIFDMFTEKEREELKKDLTKSALETLSIIIYKNGATRSEIDYIRGVNSTFILRSLMIRGLVEKRTAEEDSRKVIYYPSIDLLSYIGISDAKGMDNWQEINDILLEKSSEEKEDLEEEVEENGE
ncbi:SMC-Scp complex subunit ScpB [Candidatus Nomurabacteria bacterium]|nr:SMC-Scp complex subunit ScpB [Candidatus Nomurabacteria bacterium]USN94937.1 MAG: SMC-Scp complex subunit ScpB [Candidatus Nomurabacteria bacterium]